MICENCGEVAPIDKEKSNENWNVYDTSKPCVKCGKKKWEVDFEGELEEEE